MTTPRHCVLWSGGKDCFLAALMHCESRHADPAELLFVTLVPRDACFRCHPLGLMAAHSRFFGAAHEYIEVDEQDWYPSYVRAFEYLRDMRGVGVVVTGDIPFDKSFTQTYWLNALLADLGMALELPIEPPFPRTRAVDALAAYDVCAIVSGLKDEYYVDAFLGRQLSARMLYDSGLCDDPSFDPCGERGEYHTAVVGYRGHRFLGTYAPPLDRRVLTASVWTLEWKPELLAFAAGATTTRLADGTTGR